MTVSVIEFQAQNYTETKTEPVQREKKYLFKWYNGQTRKIRRLWLSTTDFADFKPWKQFVFNVETPQLVLP